MFHLKDLFKKNKEKAVFKSQIEAQDIFEYADSIDSELIKNEIPKDIEEKFFEMLFEMTDSSLPNLLLNMAALEDKHTICKLINSNVSRFAERINKSQSFYIGQLPEIFRKWFNKELEEMFSGKLEEFYNTLNSSDFNFEVAFSKINNRGCLIQGEEERELLGTLAEEREAVYKKIISSGTIKPWDVDRVVKHLLQKNERELVQNSMANIAKLAENPMSMLSVLRKCKFDVSTYENIINTSRQKDVYREMLGDHVIEEYNPGIYETIIMMIDELLKSQNLNLSDIEYLTSGGYSNVYRIGDKVIKIGNPQKAYSIPKKSRRFLEPLVRRNFDVVQKKGMGSLNIEISEMCEKVKVDDIDYEELYKIYKELRDDGLVWTDCKPSNLGRLRKDNIIHFTGGRRKVESVHPANVGYKKENEVEILPKGELVILDLDFIYAEDDPELFIPGGPTMSPEFEKRYQMEKERCKGKDQYDISK